MTLDKVKETISNYMTFCILSESYEDAEQASQALEMIEQAEQGKLIYKP
jgi:hypothetical protein